MQVLAGSHKLGRVNHYLIGDQAGADPERVEEAKKFCKHLHVEMEPGDALFFHSNLMHTSDQNKSSLRRWVMISSFNQERNQPNKEYKQPAYTPLEILPNSAIKECRFMNSTTPKMFMDLATDASIKGLESLEELK